jgi:hypothetical protein
MPFLTRTRALLHLSVLHFLSPHLYSLPWRTEEGAQLVSFSAKGEAGPKLSSRRLLLVSDEAITFSLLPSSLSPLAYSPRIYDITPHSLCLGISRKGRRGWSSARADVARVSVQVDAQEQAHASRAPRGGVSRRLSISVSPPPPLRPPSVSPALPPSVSDRT